MNKQGEMQNLNRMTTSDHQQARLLEVEVPDDDGVVLGADRDALGARIRDQERPKQAVLVVLVPCRTAHPIIGCALFISLPGDRFLRAESRARQHAVFQVQVAPSNCMVFN